MMNQSQQQQQPQPIQQIPQQPLPQQQQQSQSQSQQTSAQQQQHLFAQKLKLFFKRELDEPDPLELAWKDCYDKIEGLLSNSTENDINNALIEKASNTDSTNETKIHTEITIGLLYAILISPPQSPLAQQHFKSLSFFTKDSLQSFCNLLKKMISDKFQKLNDNPRNQVLWIITELINTNHQDSENVSSIILRQIYGGNLSQKNLSLGFSMLNIFSSHRQWLYGKPNFIPIVLYHYLRLIQDHISRTPPFNPTHLKEEISFCLDLLKNKFQECLTIGRDLIRLLQYLSNKLPEFEQLWKDLNQKPTSFLNSYQDLSQSMKTPTPKHFLQSRLSPEMELQLLFILKEVKFGNQKRYQQWFVTKYLMTTESESLIADLIRYICCVYHPPNHVLCSDIVPRWAIIGWLLKHCKSDAWRNYSKLSLFLDWLYYDPKVDSIMNIEPAILLMAGSVKKYPEMTIDLVEFIIGTLLDSYDQQRKDLIRNGINNSFGTLLDKGVIQNLNHVFLPDSIGPQLIEKIKQNFNQFLINPPQQSGMGYPQQQPQQHKPLSGSMSGLPVNKQQQQQPNLSGSAGNLPTNHHHHQQQQTQPQVKSPPLQPNSLQNSSGSLPVNKNMPQQSIQQTNLPTNSPQHQFVNKPPAQQLPPQQSITQKSPPLKETGLLDTKSPPSSQDQTQSNPSQNEQHQQLSSSLPPQQSQQQPIQSINKSPNLSTNIENSISIPPTKISSIDTPTTSSTSETENVNKQQNPYSSNKNLDTIANTHPTPATSTPTSTPQQTPKDNDVVMKDLDDDQKLTQPLQSSQPPQPQPQPLTTSQPQIATQQIQTPQQSPLISSQPPQTSNQQITPQQSPSISSQPPQPKEHTPLIPPTSPSLQQQTIVPPPPSTSSTSSPLPSPSLPTTNATAASTASTQLPPVQQQPIQQQSIQQPQPVQDEQTQPPQQETEPPSQPQEQPLTNDIISMDLDDNIKLNEEIKIEIPDNLLILGNKFEFQTVNISNKFRTILNNFVEKVPKLSIQQQNETIQSFSNIIIQVLKPEFENTNTTLYNYFCNFQVIHHLFAVCFKSPQQPNELLLSVIKELYKLNQSIGFKILIWDLINSQGGLQITNNGCTYIYPDIECDYSLQTYPNNNNNSNNNSNSNGNINSNNNGIINGNSLENSSNHQNQTTTTIKNNNDDDNEKQSNIISIEEESIYKIEKLLESIIDNNSNNKSLLSNYIKFKQNSIISSNSSIGDIENNNNNNNNNKTLFESILIDCQEAQNVGIFNFLVPILYKFLSNQLVGNGEFLYFVISNTTPRQHFRICNKISMNEFKVFGNNESSLRTIIDQSFKWESFEQNYMWQMLIAEDTSIDCSNGGNGQLIIKEYSYIIGKLDAYLNCEVLQNLSQLLKDSKFIDQSIFTETLLLNDYFYTYTFNLFTFWLKNNNLTFNFINNILDFYINNSNSSNNGNNSNNNNNDSNNNRKLVEKILYYYNIFLKKYGEEKIKWSDLIDSERISKIFSKSTNPNLIQKYSNLYQFISTTTPNSATSSTNSSPSLSQQQFNSELFENPKKKFRKD